MEEKSIIDIYAKIVKKSGNENGLKELPRKPPFLIKTIRENLTVCSPTKMYTGNIKSKISAVDSNIHFCISGFSRGLLKEVELSQFELSKPNSVHLKSLSQSLDFLKEIDLDCFNFINSEISLIVLLKQKKNVSTQNFGSCSFYQIPNCAFLTEHSWNYIPPNTVFISNSLYPILDNLLHEAVHQFIFECDIVKPILKPQYSSIEFIIPWRNTSWNFSHTFHAYLVYVALAELRIKIYNLKILTSRENIYLKKSITSAISSADNLRTQLSKHKICFTEHGYSLFASYNQRYKTATKEFKI